MRPGPAPFPGAAALWLPGSGPGPLQHKYSAPALAVEPSPSDITPLLADIILSFGFPREIILVV